MPEQFNEPAAQVLINDTCVPLIGYRGQRVAACLELERMMRWPGGAVLRTYDENRDAFVLDKDLFKICGEVEHSAIGLTGYRGATPVFTDSGFKKLAAFVGGLDSPLYDEVFWTYYRTRNPPAAPQPAAVELVVPTVQILDNELRVLEYKGERVISLGKIDELHQRPSGTAGRNFRENRHRFIAGQDFFEVDQPDEIRRLGISRPQGGLPEKIILITEFGYAMIVKSLNDDRAWSVYREIVRAYFRAREPQVRQPVVPALPNFEDPIAAAEAWIEQAKGRRAAELALAAESQAKAELAAKVEVLEPKQKYTTKSPAPTGRGRFRKRPRCWVLARSDSLPSDASSRSCRRITCPTSTTSTPGIFGSWQGPTSMATIARRITRRCNGKGTNTLGQTVECKYSGFTGRI